MLAGQRREKESRRWTAGGTTAAVMGVKWGIIIVLAGVMLTGMSVCAQQEKSYLPHAVLRRQNGSVTVTANDPRPLWQAIARVRKEYGWVVDYEEPAWRNSADLRDISPAAWHTAHPGRTGFLVPAGGAFHSAYTETADMWSSSSSELQVLEGIISDYNASGNPGQFVVRAQSDGGYAVLGVETGGSGLSASAGSVLDTPISLTTVTRTAENTVSLILSALSANIGTPVGSGYAPLNLLHQSQVDIGGSGVPARNLLMQLFQAMGMKMCWDLWWEPNMQSFLLRIRPAVRALPGVFGGRRLVPVSPIPSPPQTGP